MKGHYNRPVSDFSRSLEGSGNSVTNALRDSACCSSGAPRSIFIAGETGIPALTGIEVVFAKALSGGGLDYGRLDPRKLTTSQRCPSGSAK